MNKTVLLATMIILTGSAFAADSRRLETDFGDPVGNYNLRTAPYGFETASAMDGNDWFTQPADSAHPSRSSQHGPAADFSVETIEWRDRLEADRQGR
ncbi:MAG: hypothetical protein CMQ43_01715 [Gammaproteobacteria bacterium]|nr:hypothetical protein [Gammaproteobacteria bacterium]MBK79623.1 hypothetical protein [Gammaproteobacteria bacterium]|tara:strand:- start:1089 stop:1379 length:291 start_codon:yes stop_codon:yes gene_type:complete